MRGSVDQAWPFTAEYTAHAGENAGERKRVIAGTERDGGARKRDREKEGGGERERDRNRDEENTGKRRERERRKMKRQRERESETTYFDVVRD